MPIAAFLDQAASGGLDLRLPLLVALVGELLSILFVLRAIQTGKSTAVTISWSLFILAFPYVGLLFYYVMPRQIQLRRLQRVCNRNAWIEPTLAEMFAAPTERPQYDDPLLRMLQRVDEDAVHGGNRVRLLEGPQEFVQAAAAAIASAKQFVHVQTYILRPDRAGLRFLELLTAAARRGLEVRLIYDSFGSWSLKSRHLEEFHAAGGRSAPYAPLLWRRRWFNLNLRNHRKQLVVDGRLSFLGGRNIADEYFTGRFGARHEWFDTMVTVEGPAVTRIHRTFVEDWYNASDEDLCDKRYFPEQPAVGDEIVGVVQGGPDTRASLMHWCMLELIARAQKDLLVNAPYLVPHPTVMTALEMAVARGVDTRIQTNGRQAENPLLYLAQRSHVRDMLRHGIGVHETLGDYNHSKLVLVDDEYLYCGSNNLDVRSTELNFELGVVLYRSPLQQQARAMLARRAARGVWLKIQDLPRGLWTRTLEGFARLLSPLL